MEAADPHFAGVKQLFDQVSLDVVELTAHLKSSEGSQIAVVVDEKHSFGEIVFLGESMQKLSSWIGVSSSKERDIENQLGAEDNCIICPRPKAANINRYMTNCGPLTKPSRVWNAVSQPMYPVPDS